MNLFLAPHNDDEALFGSFIIQKYKPLVLVITDSFIQYNRGEKQCSSEARRKESQAACKLLGASVEFLGIPDNEFNPECCLKEMTLWARARAILDKEPIDLVFAPAIEDGGNWMHNVVGEFAAKAFEGKVKHYYTYTASRLYPEGPVPVDYTEDMMMTKLKALECYKSQMTNVCRTFFLQTFKDEYLNVA